jgi:hypothetical protein
MLGQTFQAGPLALRSRNTQGEACGRAFRQERMFTADEVSGVVDLAKLKELKHRIVHLFLYSYDAGRNQWN